MPPKKKEEVKEKPILGRFRTNLKVRTRPAVGSWCRRRLAWLQVVGPIQPAAAAAGNYTLACMSLQQPEHLSADLNQLFRPAAVAWAVRCAAAAPGFHAVHGSDQRFVMMVLQLQMGIVGLPNVGKSTLFNTLTKLSIPAEK